MKLQKDEWKYKLWTWYLEISQYGSAVYKLPFCKEGDGMGNRMFKAVLPILMESLSSVCACACKRGTIIFLKKINMFNQ